MVSSGGLPLTFSGGFPPGRADQLAAVTSGLTSLALGAARMFDGGTVSQTLVTMEASVLIVMAVSGGSALAALTDADRDMGLVAYEMALLAEQAAQVLTPQAHRRPSRHPAGTGT